MSTSLLLKMEQDLEAQIEELQAKLAITRAIRPSLDGVEKAIDDAYISVSALGKVDLLIDMLNNKLKSWGVTVASVPVDSPKNLETLAVTANENTKEKFNDKPFRDRARLFLGFNGGRLTNVKIKELLTAKLVEAKLESLIPDLNKEDPEEFFYAVDEAINSLEDLQQETLLSVDGVDNTSISPTLNTPSTSEPLLVSQVEPRPVNTITPEQAQYGTNVQNTLTGVVGSIVISGFITNLQSEECVSVQYPGGIALTPASQLVALPSVTPSADVESVKEDVPALQSQAFYSTAEWMMIQELDTLGNSLQEIQEYIQDPEILEIVKEKDPTTESLNIAAIYTFLTGQPPITEEKISDVDF